MFRLHYYKNGGSVVYPVSRDFDTRDDAATFFKAITLAKVEPRILAEGAKLQEITHEWFSDQHGDFEESDS